MRFERDCGLSMSAFVQVPVPAQDERAAVGVAHPLRDHFDVATGGDHQGRAGVPQVVKGELGNVGGAGGRLSISIEH